MISFVGRLFDSWLSEVATLAWLALALVGAIVEVSIPHFGFAFVSAAAVAAAVAAYFGFGIIPQIGEWVAKDPAMASEWYRRAAEQGAPMPATYVTPTPVSYPPPLYLSAGPHRVAHGHHHRGPGCRH